jgi:hypothetical protein
MVALIAISCKKDPGTITGVVSYFFNKYQGYKPDIGARVYLTTENCDSIDEYLRASEAKLQLEEDSLDLKEFKALGEKEIVDDLNKSIKSTEVILNSYAKDETTFKQKEDKAFNSLHRIMANKDTYKTTVDGVGNFSVEVPPGKYNVIIISVGRKKLDLLELDGQIIIKSIEVKSKEKTNIDVKFEVE